MAKMANGERAGWLDGQCDGKTKKVQGVMPAASVEREGSDEPLEAGRQSKAALGGEVLACL